MSACGRFSTPPPKRVLAWPGRLPINRANRKRRYISDRNWEHIFVGGSHEFLKNGVRNLDARTLFHFTADLRDLQPWSTK